MSRYLIKDGVLILEDRYLEGDLLIEDEKIAAIGNDLPTEGAETVSAKGCLVFPGFIDTNVSLLSDGGLKTADDFYSGTRAALAGGTTTVIDCAVPADRQTISQAARRACSAAEGKSSCDYSFHLALDHGSADQVEEAAGEGFRSFVLSSQLDSRTALKCLSAVAAVEGLALCSPENTDMVEHLTSRLAESAMREVASLPAVHPDYAESEAVIRFLYHCEATGANALVRSVSCSKSVSELRKARKLLKNTKIYSEVLAHHLALDSSLYSKGGFAAAQYVCTPALRAKADCEHLVSVLGSEFSLISSGHKSYNQSTSKVFGVNDFTKIPSGMPTVENRSDVAYLKGVVGSVITDHQFSARMSLYAAKLFGMYPQKGVLAVGSDADIVIFDPAMRSTVSASKQRMQADYNPYEGLSVEGQARAVFLRGKLCAQYGVVIEECTGKEVKRGQPVYF